MDTEISTIKKHARDELRIALKDFEGHRYVDVRTYTEYQDTGQQGPTKRGITIGLAKLPDLISALQEAERQARVQGLLEIEDC